MRVAMGILYRDWFGCASIGGKKQKRKGCWVWIGGYYLGGGRRLGCLVERHKRLIIVSSWLGKKPQRRPRVSLFISLFLFLFLFLYVLK